MKKFFALLLACMMLFSVAAMAETVEPSAVLEFDETTAAFEGDWLCFEDLGIALFMPVDFEEVEITDEWAENGVLYGFKFMDGVMTISYSEAPEGYDAAACLAEVTATGIDATLVQFNDVLVVGYDVAESDATAMVLADGTGYVFAFTAQPISNADFAAALQTVFSSICYYDAEAVAE